MQKQKTSKRDIIKGIIIGILVTTLLYSSITVFARPETTWKKIDVAYADYQIYVDGKLFEATDKNGKIESFSYNGWIYAPFEHIAKALGKSASWDGDTHTLYLGSRLISETIGLDKIKDTRGNSIPTGHKITVRGDEIVTDNNIMISNGSSLEYVLDRKYAKLTADFAIPDSSVGDFVVIFTNTDTNKEIARYTNNLNEKAISVNVDLNGVDKLRIQVGRGACLYNIYLHPVVIK